MFLLQNKRNLSSTSTKFRKNQQKKKFRRSLSHIPEYFKPKQARYIHLFIFIYLPSVAGVRTPVY